MILKKHITCWGVINIRLLHVCNKQILCYWSHFSMWTYLLFTSEWCFGFSSWLQFFLGRMHGSHSNFNNDRVVGDMPPPPSLSSTKMKLVARISGSAPVGGSVHWPEMEKGEVEPKSWSKFSQVPAALQINPTSCWARIASLVSISLPYCTHSRGSLSRASHCELPTGLHI